MANRWIFWRARVIDRVIAAVLLIPVAPVIAVLALQVRRDGGRPLVAIERVGRGFRRFGMWKIRSMRAERPDGSAAGAALTAAGDQRVTAIGRRLRSYHLDELPQLWNVVKGDMLLLGPRPEAPPFVSVTNGEWREVLSVPPGIAGPTQMIVGDWERRHIGDDPTGDAYPALVVPAKLAIDRWYVANASPQLDFLTLMALAKRFAPGSRATRMKHLARAALPDIVGPILDEDAQISAGARSRG